MPGSRVLLAVTGSIAAYKSCELVRRLRDRDLEVRVAMTPNATKFVATTTFAVLSGHRVLHSAFGESRPERIAHVRWAEECDAFCVAPASADFIAKMALGIADDFPSTLHLAIEGPVLVAPAMEDQMWRHPAVQANVETLRQRGVILVPPTTGALASGRHGPGRMAEPPDIVDAVTRSLRPEASGLALEGLKILVSAGPTREHFDPVRLISNPSSGKMGYAIAAAAARLGAAVTLVSGPTELPAPGNVAVVPVIDAESMKDAMMAQVADADIVVMAAAVSDYRPVEQSPDKLKKSSGGGLTLHVERTPDILEALGAVPGERTTVGFAAETSDIEQRAREKLVGKRCDLIVANRVGTEEGGFGADSNEVLILDRLGGQVRSGPAAKTDIAVVILEAIAAFRSHNAASRPEKAG